MTDSAQSARLLQPDLPDRPVAPPHVWDWHHYARWRDAAWTLMADLLDDRVKAEFLRRPPRYLVGDDLRWLDRIVRRATDQDVDIHGVMLARLLDHFTHLRTCHATRTSDLPAYYREGLRPLAPAVVHQRARDLFLSGAFPELAAQDVEDAIAQVGTETREGCVYFETNERLLLSRRAGHYLLYGGEYLVAIAAHLPRLRDYRQVLKSFGQPTLFICDVPLAEMSHGVVKQFAGDALERMFEELLLGEDFEPFGSRGAGFPIHRPLPADLIVGHYHPTKVEDPYLR